MNCSTNNDNNRSKIAFLVSTAIIVGVLATMIASPVFSQSGGMMSSTVLPQAGNMSGGNMMGGSMTSGSMSSGMKNGSMAGGMMSSGKAMTGGMMSSTVVPQVSPNPAPPVANGSYVFNSTGKMSSGMGNGSAMVGGMMSSGQHMVSKNNNNGPVMGGMMSSKPMNNSGSMVSPATVGPTGPQAGNMSSGMGSMSSGSGMAKGTMSSSGSATTGKMMSGSMTSGTGNHTQTCGQNVTVQPFPAIFGGVYSGSHGGWLDQHHNGHHHHHHHHPHHGHHHHHN